MNKLASKFIRIVALTEAGRQLAETLCDKIPDSEVWYKPKPFSEKIQQAFSKGEALILICATGIAVRTIAPVLTNKQDDPPVLVLDEQGQFVIPFLSGHEGGANDWAENVAQLLGAQLVMTTAKPYLKPVYTVGMGCERNCPGAVLKDLLQQCLLQAGLTIDQISSINSIDIKADEAGLIELVNYYRKSFQVFDKHALKKVENLISVKSDYVFETVGVYGVAESAALYAAQQLTGEQPELILNKQKNAQATCAIARTFPSEGGKAIEDKKIDE